MGAQGIRHVINIMGYVRDIPDRAYLTSCQLCIVHQRDCPLVLIFYRQRGCINEAFWN